MSRFVIEPLRGIVGLPLESDRSEVREFFGDGSRPFRRTTDDNESDYWPHIAVFAYYDEAQRLEALEFAPPAEVLLGNENLTDATPSQAANAVLKLDSSAEQTKDGVTSASLGVAIWADGFDDGTPVQSVLVCGTGYWD